MVAAAIWSSPTLLAEPPLHADWELTFRDEFDGKDVNWETREAIKGYLDQYNPALPAPPTKAAATVPDEDPLPQSDEEADRLWGEGDLDWFLTRAGDVANDTKPGEIILPLP